MRMGWGLGSGPLQPEKALVEGPRQASFKHGVEPLLRTYVEGERQHVQRGPPECGVQSLEVRHWVSVCGWGLGPAWLEGVSECRGRALGGDVGVGLGLCMARGKL